MGCDEWFLSDKTSEVVLKWYLFIQFIIVVVKCNLIINVYEKWILTHNILEEAEQGISMQISDLTVVLFVCCFAFRETNV